MQQQTGQRKTILWPSEVELPIGRLFVSCFQKAQHTIQAKKRKSNLTKKLKKGTKKRNNTLQKLVRDCAINNYLIFAS